eukprot:SAG31_NODE_3811_length_3861_cov_3.645401_3_plen_216_part_00
MITPWLPMLPTLLLPPLLTFSDGAEGGGAWDRPPAAPAFAADGAGGGVAPTAGTRLWSNVSEADNILGPAPDAGKQYNQRWGQENNTITPASGTRLWSNVSEAGLGRDFGSALPLPGGDVLLGVPPRGCNAAAAAACGAMRLGKGCYFLVFVRTIREMRDFYREMQRTNRESVTLYRAPAPVHRRARVERFAAGGQVSISHHTISCYLMLSHAVS